MDSSASPSRPSLRHLIIRNRKRAILGIDPQKIIKYFFGANASTAVIVLVLIMIFLVREGVDFLPTYRHELQTYRRAGLEFCDLIDRPLGEHQTLSSSLRQCVSAALEPMVKDARERRNAAYLLKGQAEEKAFRQREALENALEQEPPPAEDELTVLRKNLQAAAAAASEALVYPDLFTAQEKAQFKKELAALSPEVSDQPPFLLALASEFMKQDRAAREKFKDLVTAQEEFDEAPDDLHDLVDELKEQASSTKQRVEEAHALAVNRQQLLEAAEKTSNSDEKADLIKEAEASVSEEIDVDALTKALTDRTGELQEQILAYVKAAEKAAADLPSDVGTPDAEVLLQQAKNGLPTHVEQMRDAAESLNGWRADKPVSMIRVIGAFFFGTEWITNSSWQDFFGFVPLLAGSVVIALIAVFIATPISVVAAIYTNQFASEREKEFIKPIIEFIQAIPSVVLGFIGISLVGDLIKDFSEVSWLQWIPGFPIQERLNMFNAGCLLAFMAVPTMFSLSEDALNNVPRGYIDASDALGATKLQTVFRVIVPAGISGILSAILLGLGRVIGETMVVLLVAGNRIAIPDFSAGPGVIFQPAHTLTGIIAQELGEVSRGSSHWQALFMVGIVLFAISLLVNWCARAVARRFEPHKA
ncbi:MAG: phosphate ABC transporter permease subunit PstC [Prosthecobacter sp.]